MKIRLLRLWEDLRASYWFIPGLISLGALALAGLLVYSDWTIQSREVLHLERFYLTGPSGARALLSTIAGSAISVAGVVFSITILVLNMASAQFGPRLLRNFMHHNGTQVVLGMFVGTFVYCLITLAMVRSDLDHVFVPQTAVTVGLALGVAIFALLIYFIHHVSVYIQASHIIDDVASSLEHVLRSSFPERRGKASAATPDEESARDERLPPDPREINRKTVEARKSGYVQAIDLDGLLGTAHGSDIVIWLDCRPGHFLIDGRPLAYAAPPDKVDEELAARIAGAVILGSERTATQDPEFAVRQLVEIALRALSPGINDPFTAIHCIDRLGAVLALLGERELPSRYRRDGDGRVRLVTDPYTYGGVIDAAFNQIRETAASNPAVVIHLLEVIATVAQADLPRPYRDALRTQVTAIFEVSRSAFPGTEDRKDFEERVRVAIAALDNQEPQAGNV